MLTLEKPSEKFLKSALDGVKEYQAFPAPFQIDSINKMIETLPNAPDKYLTRLNEEELGINILPTHVKQTTFWLIKDNTYIGTYALRHELTPLLLQSGGHVAYQIRPSKQHQGYAKAGLRLILEKARALGLDKVLVTCNEKNDASYHVMCNVMMEMGGYELPLSETQEHKNRRVWIHTQKQHREKIRPLVLALIRKGNKVLLNKGYDAKKKEYFYRLPGGGIEFYETAEDALRREMREENNLEIIIKKKLDVVENLFEFNGRKGHEIIFVFEATLSDEDMKKDRFPMIEPEFAGQFTEFIEITPDKKIYPTEILFPEK